MAYLGHIKAGDPDHPLANGPKIFFRIKPRPERLLGELDSAEVDVGEPDPEAE